MSAKHQKVTISLPSGFDPDTRDEIAKEILDYIRERSQEGRGVKKSGGSYVNYDFPKYSKVYEKSLDFKIAGKSKGQAPDLKLSGDMLAAMDVLKATDDSITIGFEPGSEENARADGNIRGTYGSDRANSRRARNFLGLTEAELSQILRKYERRRESDVG